MTLLSAVTGLVAVGATVEGGAAFEDTADGGGAAGADGAGAAGVGLDVCGAGRSCGRSAGGRGPSDAVDAEDDAVGWVLGSTCGSAATGVIVVVGVAASCCN